MNQFIKIPILIISLLITSLSFGQFDPFAIDVISDENYSPSSYNCTESSNSYLNYYRLKESYIPTSNTTVKVIKINIHVFQDGDGNNNWQDIPDDIDKINQMFQIANSRYTNNGSPDSSDLIPWVTDLNRSYISFEVENIYFYKDSYLNTCTTSNSSTLCYDYVKQNYPDRVTGLNYFLTEGAYGTAAGYVNGLPTSNFNENKYVISFKTYTGFNPWANYFE